MTPTTPAAAGEANETTELLVAAAGGTALAGWLIWRSWPTITTWAYDHHLLTPTPLIPLPGTTPPGAGLTLMATLTILATLLALIVTTITAIHTRASLQIAAKPTAIVIGADAMVLLMWLLLAAGVNQYLATALSVGLIALAATVFGSALTTALARRNITRLLAARTAPHLGYTDDDHSKVIARISWEDEQPTEIVFNHARLGKTTAADVGDVLGHCLDGTYRVSHDVREDALTATLVVQQPTIAEPPHIAALREDVASPEFFGEGATVDGIALSAKTGKILAFDVHHHISRKLVDTPRPRLIERRLGKLVGGGRWRASNWDWREGAVHFSLRRDFPPMILPPTPAPVVDAAPTTDTELAAARAQVIANYPDTRFRYGVDEGGNLISWCPNRLPHTLIIGATGSGKTAATQTILVEATNAGWPVVLIDFKGIEYSHFRDWPNVTMVITTVEAAVAVIHHFHTEMKRRYSAVELNPAKVNELMPFLLIIDEYAEFMDRLKQFYEATKPKGGPRVCPTFEEIASLLRLARTSRMHLYEGVQRPDAKVMGDSTASRDQLSHRVSVGPLTTQGAGMMWESAMVGRTVPAGVRGRATAKNDAGEPVEIQCFYTPNPEKDSHNRQLMQAFDAMRPPAALWDRQVVEHPDEMLDDLEEGEAAVFSDYQRLKIFNASQRPDLDPLSDEYVPASAMAGMEHYDVSSGYLGRPVKATGDTLTLPPQTTTPSSHPQLQLVPTGTEESTEDFYWEDAYEVEPVETAVTNLNLGDLFQLSDTTADEECWVLLDGDPEPIDDNTIQLFWRDVISGEEGESIVGADATVLRRSERNLESK